MEAGFNGTMVVKVYGWRSCSPMIPTIGVMVGAYIVLRCAEIMLKPADQFAGGAARPILIFLSVGVALLAVIAIFELLSGSSDVGRALQGIR